MYFYIKCIAVIILLSRAVYTDVTRDKIENKVLALFIILGTGLMLIFGEEKDLLLGMKMAVIVTMVLFILFLIKGLGAGDIKLLAVISLYFPRICISIVAVSFIAAGIMALVRTVKRKIGKERMFIKGETIHFSIPIAIAVVLVTVFYL